MKAIRLYPYMEDIFNAILNELEGNLKTQIHDRDQYIEVVFEEPEKAADLFDTYTGEYQSFKDSLALGLRK